MKLKSIVLKKSIICIVILLFILPVYSMDDSDNIQKVYEELISAFNQYKELENEVFNKLVFKLSDFQLRKGMNLKFTLDDQLGKKWIFKLSSKEEALRLVAVSNIYALLGVKTPEIHYIELNINGRKVAGDIQEFINNQGTLAGVKFERGKLTKETLDYLLKTHIITWLSADYDANPLSFLITSKKNNKIEEVVRIDHEMAFDFLGEDELYSGYILPILNKVFWSHYREIWDSYISKKISLDLKNNYEFIHFFSYLSDNFFKKLISGLKDNKTIDKVINRRDDLLKDFKEFYLDLAGKRGEELVLPEAINYGRMMSIGSKIRKGIEHKITNLRKVKSRLQKLTAKQPEIKAVVSIEGYEALRKVYSFFLHSVKNKRLKGVNYFFMSEKEKSLTEISEEALQELTYLISLTTNKHEKLALESYIKEIKKIKNQGRPTYEIHQLMELIDVIPPNN